jgi:hypothetical protein
MKAVAALLAIIGLWIVGGRLLQLPSGTMLLGGSILFVLAMLREIWWSEKARRSIERARDEHLAKEREFGRARQRERGD